MCSYIGQKNLETTGFRQFVYLLTMIGPQAPMGFQCLAGCTLAPNRLPLEPVSDSKGA